MPLIRFALVGHIADAADHQCVPNLGTIEHCRKDSFSLREMLEELRSSLDADGMLDSSTTVLDGSKTSLPEVTAACDTVPFLSAQRLVIVEGLLARLAGGGRGRRRD